MTILKLYNEDDGFIIQTGEFVSHSEVNCVIGFSLGALVALREWNKMGKLILVNPPLPKRNIFQWFVRWLKFIFSEGLFFRRQKFTKNPLKFLSEVIRCVKLLNLDFSEIISSLGNEKLIVIKGKRDRFFCDEDALKFLQLKNIQVIEVENAGTQLARRN